MQRRRFAQWTAWLGAATTTRVLATDAVPNAAAGPAAPKHRPPAEHTKESADAHHRQAIQKYDHLTGGPRLVIGMLVYPGMFLQDLVGPLTAF